MRAEHQAGIGTHAEADYVGGGFSDMLNDMCQVAPRLLMAVGAILVGDVRWRIASRIIGDAAIMVREGGDLSGPLAMICRALVREDDRWALSGDFDIEAHAVTHHERHRTNLPMMVATVEPRSEKIP